MGYIIIPIPHSSSRGGINSCCIRFELLLFTVLAQSVAAMTSVVVVQVVTVLVINRNHSYCPFLMSATFDRNLNTTVSKTLQCVSFK